MRQNTIQTVFFFSLLLGVEAVIALMFAPFANVIAVSAVLAVTFQPLYVWLRAKLCGGRGVPAALLTLLALLIAVAGPLAFVGARVFEESRDVYGSIGRSDFDFTGALERWVEAPVRAFAPGFQLDLRAVAASVFGYLGSHAGAALSGAVSVVASLALVLIATFFFLKDGPELLAKLRRLSPLDDDDDEALSRRIGAAVNAVVRGVVLVGAIQGLLVGVGFALFGVGNATLWGFLSALLAMVPGLGTGLVTLPAVIYLFAAAKTGAAIGLAVWAFAVVGLVDNFLAPYFYSRGIEIHQLAILFAVLGGIALFGPLGFVYGPVVLALFHALVTTYRERFLRGDR
jgi:predicted PurR-regulated permease PerM